MFNEIVHSMSIENPLEAIVIFRNMIKTDGIV